MSSYATDSHLLLFCTDTECATKLLTEIADLYKLELYSYNTLVKKYGFYLKPVHIVTKKNSGGVKVYHYYGKYWYKVIYGKGKLKWLYVSKEKPLQNMPDPPLNPFTIIKVKNERNTACLYLEKVYSLDEVYRYLAEVSQKISCIPRSWDSTFRELLEGLSRHG
mgnify:CR=1 FL=1